MDSLYCSFFESYKETHGQLPLVSVCTPTFNRRPFIPAAIQCFLNQTYPADRIEWIIVDDGTDKVQDLFEAANLPQVRYYAYEEKMPLGKKRNLTHTLSTGEILVYMDDDDWYPRERISHSVYSLLNSSALCAGSSEIYVYNTSEKQMFQLGPYGPNHATAGTFAFKRDLINLTQYEDSVAIAEEAAFLKGNTIPMVQMDPIHTILVFTHDHNSFDKRLLLKNVNIPVQIKNDSGEVVGEKCFVQMTDKTLDTFFPTEKDKKLMSFYTSLDMLLGDYDLGLVKHKPDVVQQTNDIMVKRQMDMPFIPLTIDNKPVTLSITQLLGIIRTFQDRNRELININQSLIDRLIKHSPTTKEKEEKEKEEKEKEEQVKEEQVKEEQVKEEQVKEVKEDDKKEKKIVLRIPFSDQSRELTLEQTNRLFTLQHQKIIDLTNKLATHTKLDPHLLYLLDI